MPADRKRNTLARQWELLKLLPSHGAGKTTRELTEDLADAGFAVSKRQTERDLNDLSEIFPIECNNAGIPYGWRWVRGAYVDLPGITLAEALSLHIVEDSLKPLLPSAVLDTMAPRFQQAADKLLALVNKTPLARWKDKVRVVTPTLPLLPPRVVPEVLISVQSALLNGKQLQVNYRSAEDDAPSSLNLHPLAIVQRGPVTYLVATAFQYQDVRLYALQRIQEAEVLSEKVQQSAGFDLDRYLSEGALQFGEPKSISIKLRVDDGLARTLSETQLSEDQLISQEGDITYVQATVIDSWQLHWWILSQGESVEVLKPIELREEISSRIKAASQLYE